MWKLLFGTHIQPLQSKQKGNCTKKKERQARNGKQSKIHKLYRFLCLEKLISLLYKNCFQDPKDCVNESLIAIWKLT